MDRDPRVDPENGDVVRYGSLGKMEVVRNSGATVYWRYATPRLGPENLFKWPLENWQRTMKTATVIKKADQ